MVSESGNVVLIELSRDGDVLSVVIDDHVVVLSDHLVKTIELFIVKRRAPAMLECLAEHSLQKAVLVHLHASNKEPWHDRRELLWKEAEALGGSKLQPATDSLRTNLKVEAEEVIAAEIAECGNIIALENAERVRGVLRASTAATIQQNDDIS